MAKHYFGANFISWLWSTTLCILDTISWKKRFFFCRFKNFLYIFAA